VTIKRCTTCTRFREYEDDDRYCIGCGEESLEDACACGRGYDYALAEDGPEIHCPRCGRRLRGRAAGIE
jgi:DNA-directed RNA polymerase subunit RPC12/RpoP